MALARRVITESGMAPSRFNVAHAGIFALLTHQEPTAEYTVDQKFAARAIGTLGVLDDHADAAVNKADPHCFSLATDGGSGKGRGAMTEKMSALQVMLAGCYNPKAPRLHGGMGNLHVKPLGLKITDRDNGETLAATAVEAVEASGWAWSQLTFVSGDHTLHASSAETGERALVIKYAQEHECPEGQAASGGCLRHGHKLVTDIGLDAFGGKHFLESHLRLFYENIHVDIVFAKKMFIKAGCPLRLWKLWSEPTVSKWGCAEENVRLNLLPWEELMTTTYRGVTETVTVHVVYARFMTDALRGTRTGKEADAGGDRRQKWIQHLGTVADPRKMARLFSFLDFHNYIEHEHNWCKSRDKEYGFPPHFHARAVAARVCANEIAYKQAVAAPATFFRHTTAYLNNTAVHATPLAAAEKATLVQCMQNAADNMLLKHREWNFKLWTTERFLLGTATDEFYRPWFVRRLLRLVGEGAALDTFLTAAGIALEDPEPPNEVAVELEDLLDEGGLVGHWRLWKLGQHLPEWLLLATAPFRDVVSGGPTLSEELTPGLWKTYISMLFVVLTDNTPCEQKVSCYRNVTHFNQDETTAQARWKHLLRVGAERERLKAATLRSSKGGGLRMAAKTAAAAAKPLGHHAASKEQLRSLFGAELTLGGAYNAKAAAKELGALSKLAPAMRAARSAVHDAHAEKEVATVWKTHSSGPKRVRAANVTLDQAVGCSVAVPALGMKGESKGFTSAAIKRRRKVGRENEQAQKKAKTQRSVEAKVAAAQRKTEAAAAAVQALAAARARTHAAGDERAALMHADGVRRERLNRAAAPTAEAMAEESDGEGSDAGEPEDGDAEEEESEDEEDDEDEEDEEDEGEEDEGGGMDASIDIAEAVAISDAVDESVLEEAAAALAAERKTAANAALRSSLSGVEELARRRKCSALGLPLTASEDEMQRAAEAARQSSR